MLQNLPKTMKTCFGTQGGTRRYSELGALSMQALIGLQSLSLVKTPSWSPLGLRTILSFDPTERRSRILGGGERQRVGGG